VIIREELMNVIKEEGLARKEDINSLKKSMNAK